MAVDFGGVDLDEAAVPSVEFKPDGSLLARDFELYEIRDGRDVSVERITSAS